MGRKGANFEYDILDYCREKIKGGEESYKTSASGAGKDNTKTGYEDDYASDVIGVFDQLPWKIYIEAKSRKPRGEKTKTFIIKKEWLDVNRDIAESNEGISAIAFKIKGAKPNNLELKGLSFYNKDSNAIHIAFPVDHFIQLMNFIYEIQKENNSLLSEIPTEQLINELRRRIPKDE